jgi:1-acyl-sn-glycerol-3-phosphate acyltransferase
LTLVADATTFQRMRTIFTGITVFVMTCLLAPTAFVAHLLRLPDGVKQWCMRTWARTICRAAGVTVVLHGAEHVHVERGTVYASNHVSWFDVFALASVLPRYTFVAKDELRRLPIFGWGAQAAGVIFLSRENRKSAFESYREAAAEVSRGKSVIVFPEGTRGRDYHLRPFKKGPFVLAIAAKAPVVPCIVHGAREVMGKGSFAVRPNTVNVHLYAPVETAGYDYDHRNELMHVVWHCMANCLRELYDIGTDEQEIATA